MELKTGVMPTLAAAASKLGRRANQGSVRSVANQMELKTGVLPTLPAVASERGGILGWKSLGKPKGGAIWAKIVQNTRFDKEIPGTEKCADTKSKFAAELCHQGIGLTYKSCYSKYVGMWFKVWCTPGWPKNL
jgi:hypothetical protein